MLVDFLDDQGLPPEIRTVALELLAFDCALLPRSDLLEPPTAYSTVEASFDPVELSRRLLAEGEEWRDCLAAARPTRTTLSHAGGLARLDGRNCDLTGTWHGRVVACAEAARGE